MYYKVRFGLAMSARAERQSFYCLTLRSLSLIALCQLSAVMIMADMYYLANLSILKHKTVFSVVILFWFFIFFIPHSY